MNSLIRDLYKRFLIVGRDYPQGLNFVKDKVKNEFNKNKHLTDDYEIKKCIAYGRWMVKEIIGINKLHKYRAMKSRYYPSNNDQ